MNNLIADPQYGAIKTRLSSELDRWLVSQGDPGASVDTLTALQAAKRGEFNFDPPRQPLRPRN